MKRIPPYRGDNRKVTMKRNNDMKHLSYHYIVALLAACLLAAAASAALYTELTR